MDNMVTAAATGPITLADVRTALADTDPGATNANALRQIIGRGSFGTIQRHLYAIRNERAQALQPAEIKTPDAPPELLSIWGAAVAVAVAQVRTRLDTVVQERDMLTQALASASGDVDALTGELDRATADADALGVTTAQHVALLTAEAAQHVQAVEQVAQAQAALHAGLLAQVAAAGQLVQVSELQAKIGAQALQTTIDRLTDQVGELKSLLALQVQARPPVVPAE